MNKHLNLKSKRNGSEAPLQEPNGISDKQAREKRLKFFFFRLDRERVTL